MEHLQRKVFKISTTRLRNANWDLELSYEKAVQLDEVIFLFDSQMFRLIEQIRNGSINSLKEVVSVEVQNKKDFNRVTNSTGFKLNGNTYKRFVGTTGGLKNKTLIFVNTEIIDELNRRCECNRNQEIKLVPAKYEAYKALTASASTQIARPNKILVVSDVITKYKGDVVSLDDSETNEPVMEYLYNHDLENNATDGFNLCTYEYMEKVAESLKLDYIPSGVCLRNAWLKGMMFPFPIKEFAEQFGKGYFVKDIWGHEVDIRNIDIILTESSLKLWQCYNSADEYLYYTREAGYEFSVTKISPKVLEDIRALNYQYLQSYELSTQDIEKLCRPTKDWLEGSLCGDYNSTLKFLGIEGGTQKRDWTYAITLDERFLHDEYIITKIKKLIKKKINDAKIGKLICNGNYQILSGDPVILMQHVIGIEETGVLRVGEVYSQYWLDKKVKEVVAFRSPMTSHENIRKVKIHNSSEARYWYQYMKNICIVNSWDTFCMATNGSDFDGDSIYTTNNEVLVNNYRELPAIMCVQQSAPKKIITEEEVIKSNWAGMGITVGAITNRVTSQIDVQAGFEEGSEEYKELARRCRCGQLYQQASIKFSRVC